MYHSCPLVFMRFFRRGPSIRPTFPGIQLFSSCVKVLERIERWSLLCGAGNLDCRHTFRIGCAAPIKLLLITSDDGRILPR